MTKYLCMVCGARSNDQDEIDWLCKCARPLIAKKTLKGQFKDWLIEFDWIIAVELGAASILNTLFLFNCTLSFKEKMIEALCIGIILPRILKR